MAAKDPRNPAPKQPEPTKKPPVKSPAKPSPPRDSVTDKDLDDISGGAAPPPTGTEV